MPRLKSANFAVTELTAGINASATSLEVADASLFPAEGPFVIIVHDNTPGFAGVKEIMEVGSIDKNTNTFSSILRGRENTSAVAHGAGSRVECAWTAGTHAELEDRGSKGVAGGYASLDNTGNVPANQLGNIEIPNVKLLELNFLDLLIARELESLSTEMDTGYWWDNLQDANKIQSIIGATVSGGKIITTATSSEVVWRVHEIGFLTDKITFFMNRTKTTDIAPVDVGVTAGNSLITIKAATITIS